jgi:hypothetical protein
VDDFGLKSNELSDFFSAVSVGKRERKVEVESTVGNAVDDFLLTIQEGKKEVKKKKESLVGESFDELFWSKLSEKPVTKLKNKITKKKEPKTQITEEKKVAFSEPNFTEPPSSKNKDPLTPLNQNFLTIEEFNRHYKLFLNRIQQQLSTLGGGGETQLKYLDDIVGIATNASVYDQKFLQYNHNIKKFEFVDPNDSGGTTIINITGITTYYQANNIDDYIGVNSNAPVTIVLPQIPKDGKKLIIKDEGNKINTYNITVLAGAGTSVENDTSVIMSINHQSFTFFYNGTNWYII